MLRKHQSWVKHNLPHSFTNMLPIYYNLLTLSAEFIYRSYCVRKDRMLWVAKSNIWHVTLCWFNWLERAKDSYRFPWLCHLGKSHHHTKYFWWLKFSVVYYFWRLVVYLMETENLLKWNWGKNFNYLK